MMKAVAAAIMAISASSAASASTLRIFDVDGQLGQRLAGDAYFAQTIDRMERGGLVRSIDVDVPDDGVQKTSTVIISRRGNAPLPLRLPGIRILEGQQQIDITTQIVGGRLGYDLTLSQTNGFVDNATPANNIGRQSVHLYGQEAVETDGRPVFARSYDGGRRMLIGQLLR